jgi:SsrA-binding protein
MKSKTARKAANPHQQQAKTITNRRARHDYELGDSLTVGIELTGAETKSLRLGHGQLRGAYVTIKDNQLFLLNATINGTRGVPVDEQDQTRTRRLLAKRREIDALIDAKGQGRTIVPLELQTRGRYIKLRIAVGKGKRQYDKRQTLKQRDEKRAMANALKHKTQ